jgi:1-deoxyxylulose-5-phosphate synthase
MKYSLLGRTGIHVSQISLGTATFGTSPVEADAVKLVDRALELGVNFFDTANSYGVGSQWDRRGAPGADERKSAEEILGIALSSRRHEAIIATKVGQPVGPGVNDVGLSRLHINQQVEASLRRLSTDYIDIYYAHRVDPNTALVETLETFDELVQQGKIRYYALSNFPAWRIMEALWICKERGLRAPACVQSLYNLVSRSVEAEVLPVIRQYGLSMFAYSPLANGLLGGAAVLDREIAGKQRWGGPGFDDRQRAQCLEMDAIAKEAGFPPSQLAIAWLLVQPGIASTIIGSERLESLQMNCDAVNVEISDDLKKRLDGIAAIG